MEWAENSKEESVWIGRNGLGVDFLATDRGWTRDGLIVDFGEADRTGLGPTIRCGRLIHVRTSPYIT